MQLTSFFSCFGDFDSSFWGSLRAGFRAFFAGPSVHSSATRYVFLIVAHVKQILESVKSGDEFDECMVSKLDRRTHRAFRFRSCRHLQCQGTAVAKASLRDVGLRAHILRRRRSLPRRPSCRPSCRWSVGESYCGAENDAKIRLLQERH